MIRSHLRFLFIRPMIGVLRALEISFLSMGLVVGMYIPATGQLMVQSSIYPESLTVGDKFLYVNTIRVAPGSIIEPLPLKDQLGEASVISGINKIPESPAGTVSYACSLAVYKSGEFEIPTYTFAVTDSTGNTKEITGDNLKVTISSVLPPDTTGLDIADIRGPYRVRGPIWPYIVIPIGLLLLTYSGYKIYRRFRGEPKIPQVPPRAPWEVAFEQLDSLKSKRHYEFGRVKQYYFDLSFIMRAYIEGRYGFPAVERTTYELGYDDRLRSVGDKPYNRLVEFFNRADMAKFAKEIPSGKDADSDIFFAYDFVKMTIPIIEEPEKEKQEAQEIEA